LNKIIQFTVTSYIQEQANLGNNVISENNSLEDDQNQLQTDSLTINATNDVSQDSVETNEDNDFSPNENPNLFDGKTIKEPSPLTNIFAKLYDEIALKILKLNDESCDEEKNTKYNPAFIDFIRQNYMP
jgi:hypothetical protein